MISFLQTNAGKIMKGTFVLALMVGMTLPQMSFAAEGDFSLKSITTAPLEDMTMSNDPFAMAQVDDYLYTASWTSKTITVFDVSDSRNPVKVGTALTNACFDQATALAVSPSKKYLYLGAGDGTASAAAGCGMPNGVMVINITDRLIPAFAGTVGAPYGDVRSMEVANGKLFARIGSTMTILDISGANESAPVMMSQFDNLGGISPAFAINKTGTLTYAFDIFNNWLNIYDTSDTDGTPFIKTITPHFIDTVNFKGVSDVEYYEAEGKAYLVGVTYFGDSFFVLDVTNPLVPVVIGALTDSNTDALDGTWAVTVDESDHMAYVASMNTGSVAAIDLAEITNPKVLATYTSKEFTGGDDSATDVMVVDNFIYATLRNSEKVVALDLDKEGSTGTATLSSGGISRGAVIAMRASIARRRVESGIMCPSFTEYLSEGDTSEDVGRLQALLTVVAGYTGTISSTFDAATGIALRAFQASKNLKLVDSIYGVETHGAMSDVCRTLTADLSITA